MTNVRSLTRALKTHDSALFAQETTLGRVDVYRQNRLFTEPPHFLFSLTDSFLPSGRPIPYGIEVVLNRIKALDLWRDDNFVERWISEHEQEKLGKEKDFRNSIESFLYDFRSSFHKATSGINTSNLKQTYRKGL